MRLFFFTDEPILAAALKCICDGAEDVQLEKTIQAAEEIVAEVAAGNPDVVLLSFTPELHLAILEQLHQKSPGCRTVLWARSFSFEFAHQAMEIGVRGILKRTCSAGMLMKCLRKVYEGEAWFDREITVNHMHCHRILLTFRQAQLARMVAEGFRNKEIAEKMGISEGAVKVYLSHLFAKLGIADRDELAKLVTRNVAEFHDPLSSFGDGDVMHALYVESAEDRPVGGSPTSHRTAKPGCFRR